MKLDNAARPGVQDFILHALAYLLWFATILMSVLSALELRMAISAVCVAAGADRYTASFIDQVSLLLAGFAAFVYVMCLEPYYREGITLRLHPAPYAKAPPIPQARGLHRLAGWGLDLLLGRFAVTFGIALCLLLLSLAVYNIAVNAI